MPNTQPAGLPRPGDVPHSPSYSGLMAVAHSQHACRATPYAAVAPQVHKINPADPLHAPSAEALIPYVHRAGRRWRRASSRTGPSVRRASRRLMMFTSLHHCSRSGERPGRWAGPRPSRCSRHRCVHGSPLPPRRTDGPTLPVRDNETPGQSVMGQDRD